jgi:hypothetical protein
MSGASLRSEPPTCRQQASNLVATQPICLAYLMGISLHQEYAPFSRRPHAAYPRVPTASFDEYGMPCLSGVVPRPLQLGNVFTCLDTHVYIYTCITEVVQTVQ